MYPFSANMLEPGKKFLFTPWIFHLPFKEFCTRTENILNYICILFFLLGWGQFSPEVGALSPTAGEYSPGVGEYSRLDMKMSRGRTRILGDFLRVKFSLYVNNRTVINLAHVCTLGDFYLECISSPTFLPMFICCFLLVNILFSHHKRSFD